MATIRIVLSLLFLSPAFFAFGNPLGARDFSFGLQHEYTIPLDGQETPDQFDLHSGSPTYTLRAHTTTVYRPRSRQSFDRARLRSLRHSESERVEWDEVNVLGPDVQDRHTLAQLARMTANAYTQPGWRSWYDIDPEWNTSFPIGWDSSSPDPGFRGHLFLSSDNSTAILAIKGTTLNGPTSKLDKFNDNLLFSCCCARVDISWAFSTVCGCYRCGGRCDEGCLREAVTEESLFYSVGVDLIDNITSTYPDSTIWLVGHSLGGALASLLGTTFGLPAVAFESPGERLAAHRLHLPLPPPPPSSPSPLSFANAPVTHVYHTADPIPQGACTGPLSPCSQAGFALETKCHLGASVVYDTVKKLSWRVDLFRHTIAEVVRMLEVEGVDWSDEGEGREVPRRGVEVDCVDCYKWEFGDFGLLADGDDSVSSQCI